MVENQNRNAEWRETAKSQVGLIKELGFHPENRGESGTHQGDNSMQSNDRK